MSKLLLKLLTQTLSRALLKAREMSMIVGQDLRCSRKKNMVFSYENKKKSCLITSSGLDILFLELYTLQM